jgi:hypothetical protein
MHLKDIGDTLSEKKGRLTRVSVMCLNINLWEKEDNRMGIWLIYIKYLWKDRHETNTNANLQGGLYG